MLRKLHLSSLIIVNEIFFIENGALLIEGSKIIKVGSKSDFGDLNNYEIVDHGKSLICPGFINLHSHLLYSNFEKENTSDGLFPWLENLLDKVQTTDENTFRDSVNRGVEEALSTGTTYIVENTPSVLSIEELLKSPIKSLVGIEVFGSDEEESKEIFKQIESQFTVLSSNSTFCTPHSEITLSPHAAYDVSSPLWKLLIDWAEENNKLLLTHLEESPEERFWWQEKKGEGINFWKKINKLDSKLKYWKPYRSGVDFLDQNNLLSKNIIATHLCQAYRKDLTALKENGVSLVHCPRSNYYLSNGLANIALWDELGVLWGMGTDSLASNDNLDLIEEVKFAINHQNLYNGYKISDSSAFSAITSKSAKILHKDIGSLKDGYFADFLVYDISGKDSSTLADPYHLLIWEMKNKIDLKKVYINGENVWSNHYQKELC